MSHIICDTWWGLNIISKFQLLSLYGFGEKVFERYFHKLLVSERLYHKCVCRTIPATPGLLNIIFYIKALKLEK